ncbi:hypothetical protein G7Y89_g13198 [Cudoniella acicularis]|uniref:Uncharacterized protein n=1 Tax=Cudoniella acicularis TaxID=354080 RepID=A0A8H4VWA2_9HELO|nr:hypothetical protein G7Y89_g13198 [Cudoniella acicularis]
MAALNNFAIILAIFIDTIHVMGMLSTARMPEFWILRDLAGVHLHVILTPATFFFAVMSFNQHTTTEDVVKASLARSEGRTFVLTGTSENTIGGATAIAFAHGKLKIIFLTGRTSHKSVSVIKEIKSIDRNIDVVFVSLDLTDQESVRSCAKEILETGKAEKIHGLINCAGVTSTMPYSTTKQSIEMQ